MTLASQKAMGASTYYILHVQNAEHVKAICISIEVLHSHSQMAGMLTCIINMTPRDHDRLRQTAYIADYILDVDANGLTRITRTEKIKARWQTAQIHKV